MNPESAINTPRLGGIIRDRTFILHVFLFLVIFIGLFSDFFLRERLFYSRDMAGLEIPMRRHVVDLMKSGQFPVWTEGFGNGQPVLANPKNAVFYPSTWLYLFLPFPLAFKIHFLFHAIAAWVGLYFLGRTFKLSNAGAFVAATSFLLGGFYLSSIEFYNHVAAFCWIPWLLLALLTRTPRATRTLVALVVLWALVILAGAPHFIPAAIILGFLAVFLIGDRKKERFLVAFGTFAVALGVTAVQMVPAFDLVKGKAREPAETLRWSLEPIQLANLAFPNFLGADRGARDSKFWGGHLFDKGYPLYYSLYASPGLLLLALLGLRRPRDKVRVFFMVSSVVFLLLSSLRLFPFFAHLSRIPGIGLIRYPVNYLGIPILCLSFLAAFGLEAWQSPSGPRTSFLSVLLLLTLACLLIVICWPGFLLKPLCQLFVIDDSRILALLYSSLRRGLVVAAAFSAILLLGHSSRKVKGQLFPVLIGLLVADLFFANRGINPTAPLNLFDPPSLLSARELPVRIYRDPDLPYALGDEVGRGLRFQSYLRDSLYPYTAVGAVQYVYDRDFFTLYPDDLAAVIKKLRETHPATRRKILADVGCDFSVSSRALLALGAEPSLVGGAPVFFEPVDGSRRAPYLATSVVRVGSLEQALAVFERPDFEVGPSAIVYDAIVPDPGQRRSGVSKIAVTEESPGKLVCVVEAKQASLAVFPIRYDPGWTAFVDDRRSSLVRVNLISSGVVVPGGSHRVTVTYTPASIKVGAWTSLVSVLGLVTFVCLSRFWGGGRWEANLIDRGR